MTDDFLFDPWDADEAAGGPLPDEGVDTEESRRASPRWSSPSPGVERRRSPALESRSPAERFHSIPDHPRLPGESPPSELAKRLRSLIAPRLEELATRLRAARHRTLIDDRLDGGQALVRFRLTPWEGPFDEAPTVPGSVLEIQVTDASTVTVRSWLDPTADEPASVSSFDADQVDGHRVDGILLDFVESVLGSE